MFFRLKATGAAFVAAGVFAVAAAADPLPPLPPPAATLPSTASLAGAVLPLPATDPSTAQPSVSRVVALSSSATLVAAINRTRRSHGLRPLRVSSLLARAAAEHATALATAGAFTHAWPGGPPFRVWIARYYSAPSYRRWRAGENLVWQSPELTADEAIGRWLASPPHRRNLLSPAWRELGVAIVEAQGAPGAYGGADIDLAAAEFGVRKR